jgi:Xaa-Pro aminopeptidase
MQQQMQPGMTERQIWAMLHAGNIARAGEWIETQILASGPRTNPWFQEASSRIVENGDIVAYDTDLVGAYGMMIDISRTWVCGDNAPTAHQRQLFDMADEMVKTNAELLTPGRSFRELTFDSVMPDREQYRHYSVKFHGVGQCDEYPDIYHPWAWDEWGFDDELEVGMVLTSESYIGSRDGGEGVKLEDQYLVTEAGPELLTDFPVSLNL